MQRKQDRPRPADPPRELFPTSDEIFDRAREMSSQERTWGREYTRYWREAEDDLLDRAARRVIRPFSGRKP
jgi:hypothetical protein